MYADGDAFTEPERFLLTQVLMREQDFLRVDGVPLVESLLRPPAITNI